ncbi:MAG: oligoendopeptidase F [Fusobacteriota bacterium]
MKSYKNREEIPKKYKWDFTDMYKSWDEWEKDLSKMSELMEEIPKLKGELDKKEGIIKVLDKQDKLSKIAYKAFSFARLQSDTDTSNQEISQKLQRVQIMFAEFSTKTSWITPEILENKWEDMEKWLEDDRLKDHRFGLEDLYRQKEHVLPKEQEKLLSYYSQFRGAPSNIYRELSTSDIDFPEVKLSDGTKVKATRANYTKVLMTNHNREDRKKMFLKHTRVYKENENTYSAIYNSTLQKDIASMKARSYDGILEKALDGDNIPVDVYKNLLKTVSENTDPLKRYVNLRKKVLNVKDYYSYDGLINLIEYNKEYKYDDTKKWIYESVAPLGEEYQTKIKDALKDGWVDVYETDSKRSGGYMMGVYGVHPYILLNYNGTLNSLFTIAHEMGHAMHSMLSDENQPFATHDYTIFVAEVASTFNERLMLDYLLEKTEDPKEKLSLLQQTIRNLIGTFYRQTFFADYEYRAHKMVEDGKPITSEVLGGIMEELNKTYYGDTVKRLEENKTIWSIVPHFYNSPFYVYKYATSFAASAKLYEKIIKEGDEKAKEAYIDLLKSGGNDYPMEQLKKAGVDLTKKGTILAVTQQLNDLLDELEDTLKELKRL